MHIGTDIVRFGRYEVIRGIAEGGMARVYLAVQRGAGRFEKRVVLKVPLPKLLDEPEPMRMFLEEARVLARLSHPNIVQVLEVDQHEGTPYIALEYVVGPTLGRLYRHVGRPGPESIGLFLHLVRQLCDALHYAHTLQIDGRPAGIVHRDVSSQNVIIEAATGMAKLIDFGIAKAEDADLHTQLGVLKGRLHYMAPEVLAGARPDARADLYAVGVMLHRMLYGRMPHRDADLVGTRRPVEPIPVPGMPLLLPHLVVRALAPDPDHRYQTAADLSDELRRVSAAMGAELARIPPFVARVFPRGEEDWLPDPADLPAPQLTPIPSARGPLYVGLAAVTVLLAGAVAAVSVVMVLLVGRYAS